MWHAPPLIDRARQNRILPSVTSKIRRADFPERREGGMGGRFAAKERRDTPQLAAKRGENHSGAGRVFP